MPSVLWTTETARLAAAKSAERRQLHRFKYPPVPIADPALACIASQLEIVEEQIASTRRALNTQGGYCEHCKRRGLEPGQRAQLLKAFDSLLDRQRKLLKIPDPASEKQIRIKDKPNATIAPVQPESGSTPDPV